MPVVGNVDMSYDKSQPVPVPTGQRLSVNGVVGAQEVFNDNPDLSNISLLGPFVVIKGDPTGVIDVAAAYTEAITEVGNGGTILWPAGTFNTSTSLVVPSNVYNVGMGPLATTVAATANVPVFSFAGSDTVTINGGGVLSMSIRGFWNQNPAQRTNSLGISCIGGNRSVFRDLRFFSCFAGFFFQHCWQLSLIALSADGSGADQNNTGFHGGVLSVLPNAANAVVAHGCIAQNCALDGWRLENFDGSKFTSCEAIGSGQNGFYLGDPTSGTSAVSFGHFANCLSDGSALNNWVLKKGAASTFQFVQFTNCWAGSALAGDGWHLDSVTSVILTGCNSDTSFSNGINVLNSTIVDITNHRITVANGGNNGSIGILLDGSSFVNINGGYVDQSHGTNSLTEANGANNNRCVNAQLTGAVTKIGASSYFDKLGVPSQVSTPGDPAGVGGNVMLGLAVLYTPRITGSLRVSVTGTILNNTNADGATVQLRFGTGSAPANGAAPTGTAVGAVVKIINPAAATIQAPFAIDVMITGLTVGTQIWLDLNGAPVTGGTMVTTGNTITITETI